MVGKNIIAIIPARGGSRRIPGKNIIELGGKPMIAWTIEAALKSNYISKVFVSTDSEEIAQVSRQYGAEVPFLRENNADDHSPVSLATVHAIDQLEKTSFPKSDIVVQLMANCPLRGVEEIDIAIDNFFSKESKFQISSFKYGWMNPWWAHTIEKDGKAKAIFSEKNSKTRSQDLPDLFCPTGAIWIAETDELKKAKTFYGVDYTFFPMHWISALDIDDYDDLEMAKYFLNKE